MDPIECIYDRATLAAASGTRCRILTAGSEKRSNWYIRCSKMRDVDEIIKRITAKYPAVRVEPLRVHHPGMDDDGIWFFNQPNGDFQVKIESSWGACPFVIETDESDARFTDPRRSTKPLKFFWPCSTWNRRTTSANISGIE